MFFTDTVWDTGTPKTFLLLIKQQNLTPISYFINKLFYLKLLVINYGHLAIKHHQKIEIK